MSKFQTRYPGFPDPNWPTHRIIKNPDGTEEMIGIVYSPSCATPCPVDAFDLRVISAHQIRSMGDGPELPRIPPWPLSWAQESAGEVDWGDWTKQNRHLVR